MGHVKLLDTEEFNIFLFKLFTRNFSVGEEEGLKADIREMVLEEFDRGNILEIQILNKIFQKLKNNNTV